MTIIRTHQELREWGQSLDMERPQGLGASLMDYADHWRAEVEAETERCSKVAEPCSARSALNRRFSVTTIC